MAYCLRFVSNRYTRIVHSIPTDYIFSLLFESFTTLLKFAL
jgi:hypothetical protein